jgi:hypothetical protein
MPEAQSQIPVFKNTTPKEWANILKISHPRVSDDDWRGFALTYLEVKDGRLVSEDRLKRAMATATKAAPGKGATNVNATLGAALKKTQATMRSPEGVEAFTRQPDIKYRILTVPSPPVATAKVQTQSAQAVVPKPVAQVHDDEIPPNLGIKVPKHAPSYTPTAQAAVSKISPQEKLFYGNVANAVSSGKDVNLKSLQQARAIAAKAGYASTLAMLDAKIAQKTAVPKAQPVLTTVANIKPDEAAAYARIAQVAHKGGAGQFSYGKLNFAHEIAVKSSDSDTAALIAAEMRKKRPLAPGPGRYGVSDVEYKNYARVENALGEGTNVPQKALAEALKTAKKYGHTETAQLIAAKLPQPTQQPAVAAKAPPQKMAEPVTAAKSAATAATVATAAIVIPAAKKGHTSEDSRAVEDGMKKLDKYERQDLTNAGNKIAKGQPLTLKELTLAQAAADKAGLTVPAAKFGNAASDLIAKQQQATPSPRTSSPPNPAEVAKVKKTPSQATVVAHSARLGVPPKKAAQIITEAKKNNTKARQLVARGAATAQAADRGIPEARQHIAQLQQTAAGPPSPASAAAQQELTGIAAANAITADSSDDLAEPIFSRPPSPPPNPPPATVAKVNHTPSPAVVAAAGVAAGVVAAKVLSAKNGNQKDQEDIAEGAALAQGLEDRDPAAQQQLSQLKDAAKHGDKDAKEKLAGVAAAAAIQKTAVASEVAAQTPNASIAGRSEGESNVGVVIGSLLLAGTGVFLALKKKARAR